MDSKFFDHIIFKLRDIVDKMEVKQKWEETNMATLIFGVRWNSSSNCDTGVNENRRLCYSFD